MSGSLGEQEMLWEHKPQASVCTAFPSFPKLSQMFSIISFRKHCDEKKKNSLFTLIIKSKFSLLASSLHQQLMLEQCLSSYRNQISVYIFLGLFSKTY